MYESPLDDLDSKILRLISNNARISFLEVARLCGVSGAAVHQRIQKMSASNIITGSEFTLNLARIGYQTCAYVNLYFESNANIDDAATEIAKIPEVVECHHTTGAYDLLIKIYARNNSHLHQIIQSKLRPLGLTRSESTISYKESFRRQIMIDADIELPEQTDSI